MNTYIVDFKDATKDAHIEADRVDVSLGVLKFYRRQEIACLSPVTETMVTRVGDVAIRFFSPDSEWKSVKLL